MASLLGADLPYVSFVPRVVANWFYQETIGIKYIAGNDIRERESKVHPPHLYAEIRYFSWTKNSTKNQVNSRSSLNSPVRLFFLFIPRNITFESIF